MRLTLKLRLVLGLVAVVFVAAGGCADVTPAVGSGGSGGATGSGGGAGSGGIDCFNALCDPIGDRCCPAACMPGNDFDCCEAATCSTVSDACCSSTCAEADDVDCCDEAACSNSSDGCCPATCTPANDVDCCDTPCSQAADGCCGNMCTSANDADCCAVATCDPTPDGCCSDACTAANDQDCCSIVACNNDFSDNCCPDACAPTEDIDCFNAPDSIVVTPSDPSIALGETQQFTATAVYGGSPVEITAYALWSSSNEGVATVSNNGLVTSVLSGTTTISAGIPGASSAPVGSTTLRVTDAELRSISIVPVDPSITLGTKQQFTATGTYTDGGQVDLTTQVQWSSSVPTVATVSDAPGSDGLATSITVGRTTITATDTASAILGESDLDVTGPTTNRAYVANSSDGSVSVIDIVDGKVIDTITVNTGPFAMAAHPTANLVYVTHNQLDIVSVIDTTTNQVLTTVNVGDNPYDVAVNDVRNKAYIANPGAWGSGDDTVTIINTTNQQVIKTVVVGQDPAAVDVTDHGNSTGAFVALRGQVKVIDVATDNVSHTIPLPAGTTGTACPSGVAYQRATYIMRVLHNICNAPLSAKPYINDVVSTTKAVDTTYRIESAGAGTDVTVNPGVGGWTYVTHASQNTLSVTEYVFDTLEAEVPVGEFPTKVQFVGPPHNKVLVSNCTSGDVSVVDVATNTVTKTIDVGGCPRGIAVIP